MAYHADAHMIGADLGDDGTLVLHAKNQAAALGLTGNRRADRVEFQPADVTAIRVMRPSDNGILDGWVDISTGGPPWRVTFRLAHAPAVQELLLLMEAAGYPKAMGIGQRRWEDLPPEYLR